MAEAWNTVVQQGEADSPRCYCELCSPEARESGDEENEDDSEESGSEESESEEDEDEGD